MFLFSKPTSMVAPEDALPGRDEAMLVPARHEVLATPIAPPFPEGLEQIVVGMGCFWGAERKFWAAGGGHTGGVGYSGGQRRNTTAEAGSAGGAGAATAGPGVSPAPRQPTGRGARRALRPPA